MEDTIATQIPVSVLAALTGNGGKRSSNCAPQLRQFVESGEPGIEVDMTLYAGFTPQEMVQNFKNAAKATRHNNEDESGRTALYDIPGAHFVTPVVVDGTLWLLNRKAIQNASA
jgi:hypothetical protein